MTANRREPGRSAADIQQDNLRAIAVLTLSVQLFAAVVGQRTILLPPLGQFLRFPFQILLVNRILQVELLRRRSQILGVLLVAQSQLASGWRFSAWPIRLNSLILINASREGSTSSTRRRISIPFSFQLRLTSSGKLLRIYIYMSDESKVKCYLCFFSFFLVLLLKDSAKRENKFVSFVLRTISI